MEHREIAPRAATRFWRGFRQSDGPPRQPSARDQGHGVAGGEPLHVVVEVHEDVLAGRGPRAAALGPLVERAVGVAAGVELLVAVQPDVADRSGVLVDLRPAAGGVGVARSPRRGVAARRIASGTAKVGLRNSSAWRTGRSVLGGRQRAVAGDLVVVAAWPACASVGGAARESAEEVVEHVGVEPEVLRQLPQHRAELRAQARARRRRRSWPGRCRRRRSRLRWVT